MALTIILLTASLSIGRSFVQLIATDRGFNARGIVTVNVSLDGTTHQTDKQRLHYFEEVLARIRNLPGVRSASATEFLPLYATGFVGGRFGVDGRRAKRGSTMVPTLADYFQTMGGRILEGASSQGEVAAGSRVAVVNERFAAEFGGAEVSAATHHRRWDLWKIIGVVRGMEFETDSSWQTRIRFCSSRSLAASFYVCGQSGRSRGRPPCRDPRSDSVGGPLCSGVRSENHGTAFGGFFHSPKGLSDGCLDVCRGRGFVSADWNLWRRLVFGGSTDPRNGFANGPWRHACAG